MPYAPGARPNPKLLEAALGEPELLEAFARRRPWTVFADTPRSAGSAGPS